MHPRLLPRAASVVATTLALASTSPSQARLIIDTETKPVTTRPEIWTGTTGPMVQVGGSLLFGVTTGEIERDLMALDPVTQARSVVDAELPNVMGSNFRVMSFDSGRVLYTKPKWISTHELVITDGTRAGTHVLRQLGVNPLTPGVTLGARALFVDNDTATGTELYVTDGTVLGTTLLVDLFPGAASSDPELLGVDPTGSYAIMVARIADGVVQLLKTDGTAAGTTAIKTMDAIPKPIAWLDTTRFVFSARDSSGIEPWISDGTAAGTQRLADIQLGAGSSNPTHFVRLGARVLFQASSNHLTRTIYATDGTVLTELMSRPSVASLFEEPVACLGRLYFRGNDPVSGDELFVTDGTKQGTRLLVDLEPGPESSNPFQLTVSGSNVFFTGSGRSSTGLHVLRATTSIVRRVSLDVATLRNLTPLSTGSIAFVAMDPEYGEELYVSDGTTRGTLRYDIYGKRVATEGGYPRTFVSLGSRALFSDRKGVWATDASERGASVVLARSNLLLNKVVSIGSRALFNLPNPEVGPYTYDLWSTNGTAAGTKIFLENVTHSAVVHEVRYGEAVMSGPFSSIRMTDGTAAGTYIILHSFPWGGNVSVSRENEDGIFAFAAGRGLWISDGSLQGTSQAFDLTSAFGIDSVAEIVPLRNGWVFVGKLGQEGMRPWFTDGTIAGTYLLGEIYMEDGSDGGELCVQDGRVWFPGEDGIHGWELFVTDGTQEGTHLVIDARPGRSSSSPDRITAVGTHNIYFDAVLDRALGMELYRLDTRTNTVTLAAEIRPGGAWMTTSTSGGSNTSCVVGNDLIFSANDGLHGLEPFAFRHGAVATKFGRWCGVGTLECDVDPQLGSVVTWRFASGKKKQRMHILVVGAVDFEGAPLGGVCHLYLEPTSVIPIAAHQTETWSTRVTVPNDPSLIDVRVGWQVLSLDAATQSYGSSNAVEWTFGR